MLSGDSCRYSQKSRCSVTQNSPLNRVNNVGKGRSTCTPLLCRKGCAALRVVFARYNPCESIQSKKYRRAKFAVSQLWPDESFRGPITIFVRQMVDHIEMSSFRAQTQEGEDVKWGRYCHFDKSLHIYMLQPARCRKKQLSPNTGMFGLQGNLGISYIA